MKPAKRLILLLLSLLLLSGIYSGCSQMAVPVAIPLAPSAPAVVVQSNALPACEPTPFNSGNAQIITAGSSYTITRADITLVNCAYGASPAPVSGNVRAQLQGVTAGPGFDIPDGIPLANGTSTNTFDVSTLTASEYACTAVSFYFPGCVITSGQKYSLVISGAVSDPGYNLRINNNYPVYTTINNWELVFTYDGVNWNRAKSMEYYIYQ